MSAPQLSRPRRMASRLASCIAIVSTLLLTACGVQMPSDPEGTLERVRGGELRVGFSTNEPYTGLDEDGQPTGVEVQLVHGFANRLGASVSWVEGSEAALVQGLRDGSLDLAIAGFLEDSPYASEVGATQPYLETDAAGGRPVAHIMLTAAGENAFLVELETFLAEATTAGARET